MSFDPNQIRLRTPGKFARTTYVNEVAKAVNDLDPSFTLGPSRPVTAPGLVLLCKITDTGPNGEAEPTDETYWAQVQYIIEPTKDADPADVSDDQTLDDDQHASSILLVTNVGERPPGGTAGSGRHGMSVGTLVIVRGEVDESGGVRFVTNIPLWTIPVDLTYSSGVDGTTNTTNAYKYTAKVHGTTNTLAGGAALDVTMQRFTGKAMKAQHGDALANGTNWTIWWCDEMPNYTNKTVLTDVTCNGDGTITVTDDVILTNT